MVCRVKFITSYCKNMPYTLDYVYVGTFYNLRFVLVHLYRFELSNLTINLVFIM